MTRREIKLFRMFSMGIKRSGFALSLVLWIVTALMFAITLLLVFAKENVKLSSSLSDKLHTQLAVQSIFEGLHYYMLTASFDQITMHNSVSKLAEYTFPSSLILDNREYDLGLESTIALMDTSGLTNVMYSDPELVFLQSGLPISRQDGYVMRDSLSDWRDTDNNVRLNGAESSTYKAKLSRGYGARNDLGIQSSSELHLIKGFDTLSEHEWIAMTEGLYYGQASAANILLAERNILAHVLKIPLTRADDLITVRSLDQNEFLKAVNKLDFLDYDEFSMGYSHQVRVKINSKKGKAQSVLHAIVSYDLINRSIINIMNMQVH